MSQFSKQRKPAALAFLKPNIENTRAIHLQRFDACSSDGRFANDLSPVPLEMVSPAILPRVEKGNARSRFRICGGLSRPLGQRTGDARQRKVFQHGRTTGRLRHDVINVETGFLGKLGKQTIFAAVSCPLNDGLTQMVGNGHPFTRLASAGAPNGGGGERSNRSGLPALQPHGVLRRSTAGRSLVCPIIDAAGARPPWGAATALDHQAIRFRIELFATCSCSPSWPTYQSPSRVSKYRIVQPYPLMAKTL